MKNEKFQIIDTHNNAFCDDNNKLVPVIHNNNNVAGIQNVNLGIPINPNNIQGSFANAVNMFNALHQIVNQFEQNNNVANLNYNYRWEQYFYFRRTLGPIRTVASNLYMIANQYGINTQQIRVFSNNLDAYDIELMKKQCGIVAHIHILQ